MQLLWNPQTPAFWLALSALSGSLLWLPARRLPDRGRWLRCGRLLLPPYLGLLAGGLSPRLMGLSELDWMASLGLGTVLSAVALGLLALVHASVGSGHPRSQVRVSRVSANSRPAWTSGITHFVAAGLQEFHWAFLRGGFWELLVLLQQPFPQASYWAIWIAALWAGAELLGAASAHPPGWRQSLLIQAFILVSTSVLFYYTRNFWLCWLLHGTADLMVRPPGDSASAQRP